MKKQYLLISILITGLIISFAIITAHDLNFLQEIFSIIGSLSLVVALATYFYKKRQDETLFAIEQVSFFRKDIIYEWNLIAKLIKEKDSTYPFSRIKIESEKYSIEELQKGKFSLNFKTQLSLFFNISELKIDPILDKQIFLLNMLEEFSLRVKHHKTEKHPALNSIKGTFVELVEKNAVAIFFMRDIMTGNPIYSSILSLYISWSDQFKTSNLINNLQKHGFITKERKEEILKKQREKVKKQLIPIITKTH